MIRFDFNLNMVPVGDPIKIHLPQHETDWEARFRVYSNPGEISLDDVKAGSVYLVGTLPTGENFSQYLTKSSGSSGGVTTYVDIVYLQSFNQQTNAKKITAHKGAGIYNIRITKDGKTLYSPRIYIIID